LEGGKCAVGKQNKSSRNRRIPLGEMVKTEVKGSSDVSKKLRGGKTCDRGDGKQRG